MAKKQIVAAAPVANRTLTFRRLHPNSRCSFGLENLPGLAVFDLKLFAGGKPPKTITLDADLAVAPKPEPKTKAAKAVASAQA